jgi:hypothetical protein
MSKELVVILSHADTIDKVDILKKCLYEIKNQNYPVLISSHIEIPEDVKSEIDYFVYDKENPLIYHWEYPHLSHIYIWQNYPGYSQTYAVEYNHSYAVLRLIKNALGIAHINGYDKVHFVNYDYVLYDAEILQNHSNHLNSFDLFSYYYDKFEENREHINTGLFSTRVEPLFNIFKNVNSKEDFLQSNQSVFEKYMYYEIVNNGLTMEREDQEILLSTHNQLNSKSTLKNVIDDKIHVYLTKENNTENYYVYVNSTKGDLVNVNLTINGNVKNWQPKPYKVNLLRIPNELLNNGISLHIPEYDFNDYYDNNSHHSNCDISDYSLVEEGDWNLTKTQPVKVKKNYTIDEYCNPVKSRYHLINHLIEINGFKKYLEIGVFNGENIKNICIEHKDGVDPGAEGGVSEFVNYQMTSDDFFSTLNPYFKYDIIFIDGLHHSDQVDKDIQNSLRHLNDGGFILLHDCNPPEEFLQIVPRQSGLWNGDVWKSIAKLRCTEPNLEISVVDTDWGIGVITKGIQQTYNKTPLNQCLEWNYFNDNREELLNIISVDDFYKKYELKHEII